MNSQNLWNLLTPPGMFDPNGPVLNALISAIGSQMDIEQTDTETLVLNMAPQTADTDGIVVWEQILNLPHDNKLSLQQRQLRAAAVAFRMGGALTKQKFNDLLNAFDPAKNVIVTTEPSNYQVWGTFGVHDINDITGIILAATNVLPAHLQFIPILTLDIPRTFNSISDQILTVGRSAYFNNGGATKNGNVLDGTWLLDGSQLLNGTWQQGPTISSSQTITVQNSPLISNGQYSEQVGFVLDGGRKLDGSWNLTGATEQTEQIGITKSFTVKIATPKTSSVSSNQQLTTNRHAVFDDTNVLDGTWSLDGSRTLAGGLMRCAVKVNGIAV